MALLSRYRKPGGFEQLVYLIETTPAEKREKLMTIIRQEDPAWASLVSSKMLTVEKIFCWDPLVIAEIVTPLPLPIVAVALHGLPENCRAKVSHTMTHLKIRELQRLFEDAKPSTGEIWAACVRIVQKTRELHKAGVIQLQKIDPTLDLASVKVA